MNSSKRANRYVIIVAGGQGSRMKSQVPKQFLLLAHKPILFYTLNRFYQLDSEIQIILVLPEAHFSTWKNLQKEHQIEIPHQLVAGGQTRFQSVKNGLSLVVGFQSIVAVHDGVRPFVSEETIEKSYQVAEKKGNAIAVVHLKDSIRRVVHTKSQAENRSEFRLVQTPQTFHASILKEAYELPESIHFTDDASVVEKLGYKINFVEGSYENIKITTPEDLKLATSLLK